MAPKGSRTNFLPLRQKNTFVKFVRKISLSKKVPKYLQMFTSDSQECQMLRHVDVMNNDQIPKFWNSADVTSLGWLLTLVN
jgi:hypothetical protein